jgi:hypothetical protein
VSTPQFSSFNPKLIPWQFQNILHIKNFDYLNGINEMMYSGSIGSAKSVQAVHVLVRHLLENPGSRALVVRRALKDLKRTFWQLLLKHISDNPELIKSYNKTEMKITFITGSECIGDSYDDYNLEKFRSLELSMGVIEEASESEREVYDAIKMRLGRINGVNKNIMLVLTNPASPSHYLYEYFMEKPGPNRKVFYSITSQNPFLPAWYIENLKRDLDPKMARRMLYGEWLEIKKDVVYYNYDPDINFKKDIEYHPDYRHSVDVMHDFNISSGKPMSSCMGQYINGVFHAYKVFHVEGANTSDIIEEMIPHLLMARKINIYGDASGKNNDTRSKTSDYDIIKKALDNLPSRPIVELKVPKANPPLRRRHNTLNACFMNERKQVRCYLYKGCEWLSKGLRLTQFKESANLVEDDSLPEQHATTAVGYWVDYKLNREENSRPETYQL